MTGKSTAQVTLNIVVSHTSQNTQAPFIEFKVLEDKKENDQDDLYVQFDIGCLMLARRRLA